MKPIRSLLGVIVICGAGAAAGIVGYNLVENVQFARAESKVEASREQLSHAEDLATVFRTVGKAVEPSVVNITVHKKMKGMVNPHGGGNFFNDPRLRRFFGPEDDNNDGEDSPFGGGGSDDGGFEQIGTGSGVIMETSGSTAYILTNNHVAGGASEMEITLSDGRKISKAKTIGADPKTDLAVVEVTADHLIPAKWGNSDELQKGDWIMAFGSPFGYVGSMTHGIVSAVNRTDVGILSNIGGYENFVQVDAPINPGNSGGPLVNLRGEVVGINTAIASRSGGFQGIGFAIPSNMAKYVYGQLREKGKVTRGWLGVSISDVSAQPDVARSFGYDKSEGVLVQQTLPDTPAYGKLQDGDIITGINGQNVDSAAQLRNAVARIAPNQDTKLTIVRDGKQQEVTIKVGQQPDNLQTARRMPGGSNQPEGGAASLDSIGVRLGDLTDQRRDGLGIGGDTKGAVVLQVTPNSPAAKAGLEPGAVITRVGAKSINSAADAEAALSKADLKKGVRLYVTTRDASRFLFLRKSATTEDSGQ